MDNFLTKILICFVSCICFFSNSQGQTIVIGTNNTSLVFKVDQNRQLQQAWFGSKFAAAKDDDSLDYKTLPSIGNPAFPGGGMSYVFEPAIQVTHADGNPSLQLNFVESTVEKENDDVSVTHIKLKDPVYPFYVTLNFKSYQKENVIEEWATIQHEEKSSVTLQRYASSFISLHNKNFYLRHFTATGPAKCNLRRLNCQKGFIIFNLNLAQELRITRCLLL